jgi:hypothetical protein
MESEGYALWLLYIKFLKINIMKSGFVLNAIIFFTFLISSCGPLLPHKVKDAITLHEGEEMYIKGIVTHKVNFLACYYTLSDSKYSKDKIMVKCGKTSVEIGDKVNIKITPDDIAEIDGLKLRRYIEVE